MFLYIPQPYEVGFLNRIHKKLGQWILKSTWPIPGALNNELEVALESYLPSTLKFRTSVDLQIWTAFPK